MKELGITKGEVKPEFTIEQIRAFVAKNYNSVSARYVKSALQHYDEAVRQRDELREALADMVNQFAYEGTKNGEGVMRTGGLSALEDAFVALGLSDPITVEDFEAAIKNTDG